MVRGDNIGSSIASNSFPSSVPESKFPQEFDVEGLGDGEGLGPGSIHIAVGVSMHVGLGEGDGLGPPPVPSPGSYGASPKPEVEGPNGAETMDGIGLGCVSEEFCATVFESATRGSLVFNPSRDPNGCGPYTNVNVLFPACTTEFVERTWYMLAEYCPFQKSRRPQDVTPLCVSVDAVDCQTRGALNGFTTTDHDFATIAR